MRTEFKNNILQTSTAASAPRGKGVTTWEACIEAVSSVLDKAAILGLISYAVAITMRIAEIV